ncbi:sugar ABC transporter ATP-binding protein [Nesterenkonia flava]|uniref:Sugar ABC transporter ATP-binding protein n=2 Tax=Nesterenkonia TaxID=57494 RepID=A0ABU1FWK9_9MICC|nr:sugar ABC transporter ATP-binding protein [Nesterenkonia flava]MDR5712860.1 sugar ABC transporter ATP-binding protein [Nesterenkonia flava]
MTETPTDSTLVMRGITKSFPGVKALTAVDLDVQAGEVHAIVGENGAGKSTLMKILAGVHPPDEGTVTIDGQAVRFDSPLAARKQGVGMVYQEINLVPDLTVAENISLGQLPSSAGVVNRRALNRTAARVLQELGARIDPQDLVGRLSVSQQQLVEIAKVYASQPRIVVFDEPTSSLSEHEAQALFRVLERMRANDIAIIYISHRLREVLDISDRVTVLRDGRMIDCRPAQGLTPQEMIRLMVGRDLDDVFPKREVTIGNPVLEVSGLSRVGVFEDISLTAKAGEIVGLAGLVGAGRTEVARAIFGLDRHDAGSIRLNGQELTIRRPKSAVRAGIAYVPEDRKRDGVALSLSVKDNISLSVLRRVSKLGWIRRGQERVLAQQKAEELYVSPPAIDRKVATFSGGNQQKVVLAKWLATEPKVLILDEPTRGVDVGAKADIHTIIGELAERGVAIIMISSELPEILAVSDRVYVLHEGRMTAELERSDATEESVMSAATGEVMAA